MEGLTLLEEWMKGWVRGGEAGGHEWEQGWEWELWLIYKMKKIK